MIYYILCSPGFIGLGNMGHFMARNLMKKGHKLVVFDINSQIVNDLVKGGATAASSPSEV
jgi:3-hydroxyisobutyrate dehydrogenase-like beta-hydroxyacid dehydrogenase